MLCVKYVGCFVSLFYLTVLASRYSANLVDAKNFGIRKGWISGIGMGAIYLVMFGSYGLAFWYGSELVRTGEGYTAGSMITVR